MVQKNSIKNKIIIICGPTASSKTALAVECAKLLDTEVVSADSIYVYKGLNVGTAKPSIEEMQGIPHHLIDVINPSETFSVGDYKKRAEIAINDILNNGKTPIICGGTGFYINSILYDFSYGNSCANLKAREYYKDLAEKFGNQYVHDILKEKDPISAEKIHFNDSKRVIRALEIFESGNLKSEILDDLTPKYDYKAYTVNYPRDVLYERINKRVDLMFENGLIEEFKGLIDSGINENHQCMQGIGYKEIFPYLKGEISIDECKDIIKLNTRHYAKRQITFFKKLANLIPLEPNDIQLLAQRIVSEL